MSYRRRRTEAVLVLYACASRAGEARCQHGERSPEYRAARAETDRAREALATVCRERLAKGA